MKKFDYLICIVLVAIILSTCATSQVENGMIDPGDKLGDISGVWTVTSLSIVERFYR